MKRIKAWFLILVMVFSLASLFVGCSTTGKDSALTMGQWLSMVADSFGLAGYTEEKPFFEKVGTDNSYFSVFQACAEWDIVEPSDTVDEKTPVTWNDVLISLVNAGEFMDIEASDEEKVAYAIEHFDSSIRSYWGGRYIKMSKAVTLLETAQSQWANFRYTETVETITMAEGVTDLLEEDLEYVVEDNVVTVDAAAVSDLQPGDVYTLPACGNECASINRVASIEIVDGQAVITNDETFTQEEALESIEELNIEETATVNMDEIAGIYDENGNPIDYEVDPSVDLLADMGISDATVIPLSAGTQANNLGLNLKGSLNFDIETDNGTWKVTVTAKKDDIAVKVAKETTMISSSKKEQKKEVYAQVAFKDMELTKDVKISWGKLKSAKLRLDYGGSIEGGASITRESNVGKEENSPGAPIKQNISTVLNEYKEALSTIGDDWRNRGEKDDLYICRLAVPGTGGLVNFIIKGQVSLSGELKIVVEIEGSAGVQYKDGKLRYIKNNSIDANFVADGKLEVTASIGFEITVLKVIDVAEVTGEVGAGLGVTVTTHLLDAEGHSIYSGKASLSAEDANNLGTNEFCTDVESLEALLEEQGVDWDAPEDKDTEVKFIPGICFDWKLYPIAKINLGGEKTLVGKLAKKLGFKVTLTIKDDDDAFLKGHFDLPGSNPLNAFNQDSLGDGIKELLGVNKTCSLDLKPWPTVEDKLEETSPTDESVPENTDYQTTDRIMISTVRLFMTTGETAYIEITELPEGYTLNDLEAVVADKSVVTFDTAYAKVTAVGVGTTEIEIRTKDGKENIFLAVTVSEPSESAYSGFVDGFVFCGSTGGPY